MECMVGDRLGFSVEFENRAGKMKEDIGRVIFERYQENFDSDKVPEELVKEAFEQRFEEIRRRRMRKTIPGLMPEHERPVIFDPEWDDRDDEGGAEEAKREHRQEGAGTAEAVGFPSA